MITSILVAPNILSRDNFKQECSCKRAPGDWAKSCIGFYVLEKNGGVIELECGEQAPHSTTKPSI